MEVVHSTTRAIGSCNLICGNPLKKGLGRRRTTKGLTDQFGITAFDDRHQLYQHLFYGIVLISGIFVTEGLFKMCFTNQTVVCLFMYVELMPTADMSLGAHRLLMMMIVKRRKWRQRNSKNQ